MNTAHGRRASKLAVLYETTRDLATQRDLPVLLDTIVERAIRLLAASAGNVYLYDLRRQDLEQVAGTSPVPLGTRLQLGEGVAGQVAQSRQPVLVRDYRSWAHRSAHYEGAAITAVVGVPLLYNDDLIGVLAVAEIGTTTRRFIKDDVYLLALFAGQAASAVHNARLFAENRLLEDLERLRADSITTITHDLRTPLTALRAGLGMLESSMHDRLLADEREVLEATRRNSERLGMLIDDLLAFNQLEAGTLQLEREPLDLRDIIGAAIATLAPLISGKEQVLVLDLPESLLLRGDLRRLEHVVVNLVAYAHRHAPPKSRITVSGRHTETDVRISVSDDGPGIPAAELPSMFLRFHHVTAAEGGSGLGLAIARAIVERYGGRVWAESQLRQGTTFWLALPKAMKGGNR